MSFRCFQFRESGFRVLCVSLRVFWGHCEFHKVLTCVFFSIFENFTLLNLERNFYLQRANNMMKTFIASDFEAIGSYTPRLSLGFKPVTSVIV